MRSVCEGHASLALSCPATEDPYLSCRLPATNPPAAQLLGIMFFGALLSSIAAVIQRASKAARRWCTRVGGDEGARPEETHNWLHANCTGRPKWFGFCICRGQALQDKLASIEQ